MNGNKPIDILSEQGLTTPTLDGVCVYIGEINSILGHALAAKTVQKLAFLGIEADALVVDCEGRLHAVDGAERHLPISSLPVADGLILSLGFLAAVNRLQQSGSGSEYKALKDAIALGVDAQSGVWGDAERPLAARLLQELAE